MRRSFPGLSRTAWRVARLGTKCQSSVLLTLILGHSLAHSVTTQRAASAYRALSGARGRSYLCSLAGGTHRLRGKGQVCNYEIFLNFTKKPWE